HGLPGTAAHDRAAAARPGGKSSGYWGDSGPPGPADHATTRGRAMAQKVVNPYQQGGITVRKTRVRGLFFLPAVETRAPKVWQPQVDIYHAGEGWVVKM